MGICVIAPVGPTKILLLLWHLCREADFRVMRNKKGRTKKSEKRTLAAARLQKVRRNLQNNSSLRDVFVSRGERSFMRNLTLRASETTASGPDARGGRSDCRRCQLPDIALFVGALMYQRPDEEFLHLHPASSPVPLPEITYVPRTRDKCSKHLSSNAWHTFKRT